MELAGIASCAAVKNSISGRDSGSTCHRKYAIAMH